MGFYAGRTHSIISCTNQRNIIDRMLAFAPGFGVELAPVGAYQVIEVLGHIGIELMFLRLGRLVVPVAL